MAGKPVATEINPDLLSSDGKKALNVVNLIGLKKMEESKQDRERMV